MGVPGNANALLLRSAAAAGGYQVSRSLRFNSADSASCSRAFTSTGNRRTWTWAAWIKRSAVSFSAEQHIWGVTGTTDATYGEMFFGTGDTLRFAVGYNTVYGITTTRVFRDPGAWFHVVLAFDATQSTAANKIKLYINGVEETTFSSDTRSSLANQDWGYNNNVAHYIGRNPNSDIRQFNGYLADIHFIDGQALTPSSFAETDATTGQWIPKLYSGSYGTNGFKLNFSDNSAATAAALGKDTSGNSNNWTPNNLSVTAGAGNDSLVDSITSYGTDTGAGGEVRGNYCTLNPLANGGATLTDGNLNINNTASDQKASRGTFGITSGKWYWEATNITAGVNGVNAAQIGISTSAGSLTSYVGSHAGGYAVDIQSGDKYNSASNSSYFGGAFAANTVIGVAFDADNGTLTFYKNGTSGGVAFSSIPAGTYFPAASQYNANCVYNFGQRAFAYTAPSGFKALVDTNLTAPVIAKPNTVMDVALWTGNSTSGRSITGLNTSPDLVWIKSRSDAAGHALFDAVRGTNKVLRSMDTSAEVDSPAFGYVSQFNSSGFTLTAGTYPGYEMGDVNMSGRTYVAWAWDAGTSTTTINANAYSAGVPSITSSVRANASAGFSIVTYTGSGANATVGHGGLTNLSNGMIIVKQRSSPAQNWWVGHGALGWTKYLEGLNTTAAAGTSSSAWNNTAPTSTVFNLGTETAMNSNGLNYVAYCFAPVAGYSSMGSYVGNGSTDGPFVFCGFRPRFLLAKSTGSGGWVIYDAARDTYNFARYELYPHTSNAEVTNDASYSFDFLSNGFKVRRAGDSSLNTNGQSVIWAAFAESPFQYARAR